MVPTFSLELNLPRYEGGVPPANTSRAKKLVSVRGFEPLPPDPKSGTLPDYAIRRKMAPVAGIEPTTNWLTVNCTTAVLHRNKNGTLSQIRTETLRLLRPLSLPIGVRGQNTTGCLFFNYKLNFLNCWTHPKTGGGRGYRTLLDTRLAKRRRSPELPP